MAAAMCSFNLRRYDEALAAYDQAIALKPDLAEAWLGRGDALADLNRDDDALACFDKAIELKPDLASAYFSKALPSNCRAVILRKAGRSTNGGKSRANLIFG